MLNYQRVITMNYLKALGYSGINEIVIWRNSGILVCGCMMIVMYRYDPKRLDGDVDNMADCSSQEWCLA
jgi:hypothetical protein